MWPTDLQIYRYHYQWVNCSLCDKGMKISTIFDSELQLYLTKTPTFLNRLFVVNKKVKFLAVDYRVNKYKQYKQPLDTWKHLVHIPTLKVRDLLDSHCRL